MGRAIQYSVYLLAKWSMTPSCSAGLIGGVLWSTGWTLSTWAGKERTTKSLTRDLLGEHPVSHLPAHDRRTPTYHNTAEAAGRHQAPRC